MFFAVFKCSAKKKTIYSNSILKMKEDVVTIIYKKDDLENVLDGFLKFESSFFFQILVVFIDILHIFK